MLVTFFALAVLQCSRYWTTLSSSLSDLQTGLGGTWALLLDALSYVNADWLGDPSGLFPCLSLGPQLPGALKNCSAHWQTRKKGSAVRQSQSICRNVLLCMPKLWYPTPLILACFSFSEKAMNCLSVFMGCKKQKGAGMSWLEESLGYWLLNFLGLI